MGIVRSLPSGCGCSEGGPPAPGGASGGPAGGGLSGGRSCGGACDALGPADSALAELDGATESSAEDEGEETPSGDALSAGTAPEGSSGSDGKRGSVDKAIPSDVRHLRNKIHSLHLLRPKGNHTHRHYVSATTHYAFLSSALTGTSLSGSICTKAYRPVEAAPQFTTVVRPSNSTPRAS